jgi:beta-xylosidase
MKTPKKPHTGKTNASAQGASADSGHFKHALTRMFRTSIGVRRVRARGLQSSGAWFCGPVPLARRLRPAMSGLVLVAIFGFLLPLVPAHAGNPVFPGWYADPEGVVYGKQYWIYPTYSAPYGQQVLFDAFSSPDLVTWTKHSRILDTNAVKWARRAMWAPAALEKGGRYFLFFGANDIQNDQQRGGIGVAVAERPEGPFKDYLGKPLIDRFYNGAQPIDQFVFKDRDGQYYMIYGGWRHCNIARLREDFTGFDPFPDGATFKEITPEGYVEGPFMFLKEGKYYFMWSEGGWTGPNYSVAYAIASSPLGPFKRLAKILQQDPAVATGAGHHSVIKLPGEETYYIVYHRRPLGEKDGNHRVTCIDRMEFDAQGLIKPVKITFEGVEKRTLP